MTKKEIIKEIERRVLAVQKRHGFSFDYGGWCQVEGKPIEVIVAYGEFEALSGLLDDIDS